VEIDWIVVICYFCDKCKRQVVQLTGQKTSPEKICLEEGKKVILIVVFEMCALHLKVEADRSEFRLIGTLFPILKKSVPFNLYLRYLHYSIMGQHWQHFK